MEEDVLGPREEAVGERYVVCTNCGRVFPRSQSKLADREVPESTKSEQAELCPDCQRKREISDESEQREHP